MSGFRQCFIVNCWHFPRRVLEETLSFLTRTAKTAESHSQDASAKFWRALMHRACDIIDKVSTRTVPAVSMYVVKPPAWREGRRGGVGGGGGVGCADTYLTGFNDGGHKWSCPLIGIVDVEFQLVELYKVSCTELCSWSCASGHRSRDGGIMYLTSLPLVSVRRHGHVIRWSHLEGIVRFPCAQLRWRRHICTELRHQLIWGVLSWRLTRSLPSVINFKFLLQPHQKQYFAQYEELGFSLRTQIKDY